MPDSKEPTHNAFAMKRLTKTRSVWLDIGTGRLDGNGAFHGFIDRLPVGGFTGYVYFAPDGEMPPDPEPKPQPPGGYSDDDDL
jgi:hypothetical protein